jgi:hypothetical protein
MKVLKRMVFVSAWGVGTAVSKPPVVGQQNGNPMGDAHTFSGIITDINVAWLWKENGRKISLMHSILGRAVAAASIHGDKTLKKGVKSDLGRMSATS